MPLSALKNPGLSVRQFARLETAEKPCSLGHESLKHSLWQQRPSPLRNSTNADKTSRSSHKVAVFALHGMTRKRREYTRKLSSGRGRKRGQSRSLHCSYSTYRLLGTTLLFAFSHIRQATSIPMLQPVPLPPHASLALFLTDSPQPLPPRVDNPPDADTSCKLQNRFNIFQLLLPSSM